MNEIPKTNDREALIAYLFERIEYLMDLKEKKGRN